MASAKIVFGVQPNEAQKDFKDLAEQLKTRLGVDVEFRASPDYRDLIEKMTNSEVDLGFFSPLNFVEIEKKGSVKVLLKKVYGESEFYHSTILTTGVRSDIKGLKQLAQKKIAFVDPNSASGFLYPRLMLSQQGVEESRYESIFAGTHEDALKLLESGQVDAAAVWADNAEAKTGSWTHMTFDKPFVPRVLAVSAPIPNDALVVRKDFYERSPEMVLKIMDALILISEETKILKDLFGVDRLVTATSRHYESVRELNDQLNQENK